MLLLIETPVFNARKMRPVNPATRTPTMRERRTSIIKMASDRRKKLAAKVKGGSGPSTARMAAREKLKATRARLAMTKAARMAAISSVKAKRAAEAEAKRKAAAMAMREQARTNIAMKTARVARLKSKVNAPGMSKASRTEARMAARATLKKVSMNLKMAKTRYMRKTRAVIRSRR